MGCRPVNVSSDIGAGEWVAYFVFAAWCLIREEEEEEEENGKSRGVQQSLSDE